MAIYYLDVGVVSRKTGRSSPAVASYISSEKIYNEREGKTYNYGNRSADGVAAYLSGEKVNEHNFTNKRGIVHTEIILPDYAPGHYADRATLWNAVEKAEKRKDAQTARIMVVALPVEFSREEQIEHMREYIQKEFVNHGMIADFAIHDKGDGNPHAHILLTMRDVDKNGFKAKNRDWNRKEYLLKWRESWAVMCNERLRQKGYDERIDHRTLGAQGIDREPQIHVGVTAKALERKGIITARVRENYAIIERNKTKTSENTAQSLQKLRQGYVMIDKEIAVIEGDIKQTESQARTLEHQVQGMKEDAPRVRDQLGRDFFKKKHGIEVEQAEAKIKECEDRARSYGNLCAKLQEKLTPYVEDRAVFEAEYKSRKLIAEIRPDWQIIHDRLKELEQEDYEKTAIRERVKRMSRIDNLDNITEQDFERTVLILRPDHAGVLARYWEKLRERERERERIKTLNRVR